MAFAAWATAAGVGTAGDDQSGEPCGLSGGGGQLRVEPYVVAADVLARRADIGRGGDLLHGSAG